MPEGKNKIGRPRRNGIYGGAIISRIRSQIRISPNSPSPTTDVNRNPGVTSGRKAKAGSNPGAGPASVADTDQLRRGRHSPVIERRKKGIKNVKGQVSEKRASKGESSQPRKGGVTRTKGRGYVRAEASNKFGLNTRMGLSVPHKRKTPNKNPRKKEPR